MNDHETPGDPDEALDEWDRIHDEEGPAAAAAYLQSLPERFRAAVEAEIARVAAVEQALRGNGDGTPAVDGDESVATGKPGRYEIIDLHAQGGMGIVYRARDVELGRVIAYKVMKRRYHHDADAKGRFHQEAEATSKLQHPGIVPVLGLVEDGSGLPAYAMEFVEGSTLAEAITEFHETGAADDIGARTRRRNALLRHFIAACRVVAYAHDRGYVHGDLKPENILIDRYGATRVVDWGVSRFVSPDGELNAEADRVSRRIATRGFHGPSAFQPGVPATFASDVSALGATLLTLVTGGPPSDDLGEPRPPAAAFPPALDAVCRRAMHQTPAQRYPSPSALADDVQRFIDDEPNSAYRDRLTTRLRRWIGRHKTISVAGLLTVLFACLAATTGTLAKSSLDRAARRERDRVRFEDGRRPFDVVLTLASIEYLAKDRKLAVETYDDLLAQIKPRLVSEFATTADTAQLARCYFARGFAEMPGQQSGPSDAKATGNSTLERILSAQQTRGFLTAFTDSLNRPGAVRAEAWFDKAVRAFDSVASSDTLTPTDRDAHWNSLLARALMRMQSARHTEALMDWDRLLAMGGTRISDYHKASRGVARMAAEQEQANPAWSRPPKAWDPKTMTLAQYLAQCDGVSDAAVYNAACVFSLASLEEHAAAAERNRRAQQAVGYLARIAGHGYFKGDKQRRELLSDSDLDPLRALAEFQAIVPKSAEKSVSPQAR